MSDTSRSPLTPAIAGDTEPPAPPAVVLAEHQVAFGKLIAAEPGARGRVLEIGCGPALHPAIACLADLPAQLDGVDPSEEVHRHPHLSLRWQAPLEEAAVPENTYDLAVAFNVVEHLANPRPFLEAVHRVLKPGGVFWALTPHANHPFCMLSRALDVMTVKYVIARHNAGVNDYPAYYRLNRKRQVRRAIKGLGFDAPRFEHFTAPGWHVGYFPRALHWGPVLFDRLLGDRFKTFHLIFAFALRRST
jgi:SAM-dependent methyltransferase